MCIDKTTLQSSSSMLHVHLVSHDQERLRISGHAHHVVAEDVGRNLHGHIKCCCALLEHNTQTSNSHVVRTISHKRRNSGSTSDGFASRYTFRYVSVSVADLPLAAPLHTSANRTGEIETQTSHRGTQLTPPTVFLHELAVADLIG